MIKVLTGGLILATMLYAAFNIGMIVGVRKAYEMFTQTLDEVFDEEIKKLDEERHECNS